MAIPSLLQHIRLPLIAAPMFTVSYPELVIAQCRAGIVGAFPALNARPQPELDAWLKRIAQETTEPYPGVEKCAPYAVNLIIHGSNERQAEDAAVCIAHKVKILITSLGAPPKELVDEVHGYGGIVLHDVIHAKHAKKALEAGVDGLIVVASGAGGHAGRLSPFALVAEIRQFYPDGFIILSGAIASGGAIVAAQALGADMAYMGTRFIATQEANAAEAYKQAVVAASTDDIVYTDRVTGVLGNYLKDSLIRGGIDLDDVQGRPGALRLNNEQGKAWKDIWGAGQSVAAIGDMPPVETLVNRLATEYRETLDRLVGIKS
ncbi:nitronate monooxygenase [Robbsia andropogonis]|uniref:NAD(P)H-dependent flavin oxidoreductase n=1 Tax=Robbsia andropogonis TaxID=28092 RepID=UPI00209E96E1|nr:nitronate monooxygenase family protein [Robbsia andropogonis]MCP1120668.1 nitronate monooxygenase family protein [Robbsia andropogonis]MCP1130403.1 nitronate monooxygenase family protein [Robbsia andropogonis]